jgi:hypothetical protein
MSIPISGDPGGDGNGLVAILGDLINDPKKRHVAVVILDCKKITTNSDTSETVPTARVRRIEVITGDEDKKVLERLMRRALDTRTGREALPYDLEEEISGVFDDMEEEPSDDDNG